MGVSTYCIVQSLWWAKTRKTPRGIIYWQPTDGLADDFAAGKRDPFVKENIEHIVTGVKDEANNLGLKFFYGVPTYWRGLKSEVNLQMISGDAAIYDEYDKAEPAHLYEAEKRLGASTLQLERRLSTPTLPDYGINRDFQLTDQHYYAFTCTACGYLDNILELNFPKCFQLDRDGHFYRACLKCKAELDISKGQWVQTSQSDKRGYHISQLYSPFKSADKIMHEFQTTEFIGHFHNHVIGVPYLSATDRVSMEQVLALCDPMVKMRADSLTPTVMGIDVGAVIHWIILMHNRLVACGESRTFEEIDEIIKRFKVSEFVIDALPETRKARELVMRHPFKGWLCFYNSHQKGAYKWDEEQRIVTVNRTESLDHGTYTISKSALALPQRDPVIEVFARHCANIAKVCEEDPETGAKEYTYKKIGPDHYRHALNYGQIAASHRPWKSVISIFRT